MSRKNRRRYPRNNKRTQSNKRQVASAGKYTASSSAYQKNQSTGKKGRTYQRAINPAAVNAVALEVFGGLSYQSARDG